MTLPDSCEGLTAGPVSAELPSTASELLVLEVTLSPLFRAADQRLPDAE